MQLNHYDIIIVGSGPGGAAAGITAAKNGYKTLILEKDNVGVEGRYKACGGAIAWEVIEQFSYPEEKISRIIESLELHHIDGEIYSKAGRGAIVYRGIFDKVILDNAINEGCIFKNCEPLESITKVSNTGEKYEDNLSHKQTNNTSQNQENNINDKQAINTTEKKENGTSDKRENDLYSVTTKKGVYTAKYIIAADGINSRTLRLLHWPYFDKKDLVLTITDERKTTKEFIDTNLGTDKVHLYFGIKNFIPMGYAWLFPKDDVVTMGWGNRWDYITDYKSDYNKFLRIEPARLTIDNSKSWVYRGHLIPVGVRSQIYKECVFAIGDAGGFVDPISGKGIPYAMMSGEIAIKTIKKCESNENTNNDRHLAKIYKNRLDSQFLAMLTMKKQARERIFENDENLKRFLSLWEKYRSSEIILRNMI